MEHWIDGLTRTLARQPVSRRFMLSWTARLGLAATGAGLLARTPTVAEATGIGAPVAGTLGISAAPAAASTCTVSDSYGVLKAVVEVSSPNLKLPLTLSHTFIAEVGSGNTFSRMTIKSGDEVIQRLSTVGLANGAGAAGTLHGPRYTGVRRSDFFTDGRTVEGLVDGRATDPAPLGTDVKALKFKDGKPERPVTQAAPDVEQAVAELLRQAPNQLAACQPPKELSPVVATCTSRQLDCREAWVRCSLTSVHTSLASGSFAPAAYLGASKSSCDAALQRCYQSAKGSGACCPDFCKGDAACCQSAWGCCGPSPSGDRSVSKAWPTCPRCGPPLQATPVRRPAPGGPR